ncbi:MAG: LysM peptidoglycan-binding domain-containing protein [Cuspidothrix sp.]
MNTKTRIDCPVCGYQGIQTNTCPNCETDIYLIHSAEELHRPPKSWTTGIGISMLMVGLIVGAAGSFFTLQAFIYTTNVSGSAVSASSTSNSEVITTVLPQPTPSAATYTVQSGDTLSGIAAKFCSKSSDWKSIVAVNPELQKRENQLDVGQVLKIPSKCKSKS